MRLGKIVDFVLIAFYLALAFFVFLLPGFQLVSDLRDPALRTGAIPQAAWRLHENLATRYGAWANARMASQRAAHLDNSNVADTEWPLFGSVFYLFSVEALQEAWEADHRLAVVAPGVLAHGSVEAAVNLVLDPNHATWVKAKYGDAYLQQNDLFYRFLRIAAMTCYTRITGNPRLMETLRAETNSLADEIDRSPHGLLEDYPSECYPPDVVAAIAGIVRADKLLGIDSSAFVQRARRAFQSPTVGVGNLPPYMANPRNGQPEQMSRGTGDSYVLTFSPEFWPDQARDWYAAYDKYFWQQRIGLVGFRELSNDLPDSDQLADVDSGPVILKFGMAASAFGVAAARANGRMDEAAPLTGEMLATSWPMVGGMLLVPRLMTQVTDAPYLGEAGILFCLTRTPVDGIKRPAESVMTPFTWAMLALYFVGGALLLKPPVRRILKWKSAPRSSRNAAGAVGPRSR
jgi:hypothetical protein